MLKPSIKRQQGAVLLVSMILLIVLTLYGLSASNSSMMQVKMTTTNNDAQLALSAAEAAVQQGVLNIEALTAPPDESESFSSRGNIYLNTDAAPVLTSDTTWDGNGYETRELTNADALTLDSQSARYFIVYHGIIKDDGSADESSTLKISLQLKDRYEEYDDSSAAASTPHLFRIVAMGEGAAGSSRRLVEAFYRKVFVTSAGTE